jgi:hypothetical protein
MSASDRKIEQDIVYRLLHDYGAPTNVYKDTGIRQADTNPWYTFSRKMYESHGMRALPSVMVSAFATLMTIAVSAFMVL